MSSNPSDLERPHNPTHFGGEGLYDSAEVESDSSLKVSLGDHLDPSTRRSLASEQRGGFAVSSGGVNRLPLFLALGSAACLVAYVARRSMQK
jgi:hypothetical protein